MGPSYIAAIALLVGLRARETRGLPSIAGAAAI
eukprot:COSAG02_NODE_60286_length_271_cov_1.802326_1_plen_32_part_01